MDHEIFGDSFTNFSDPKWVPEPGTRGTFGILSVCLVTLGLCVWTAIHLNVPGHNEPAWKQLMRKIGWLIFSLLSPELIAYMAYRQYVQARSIMNTMNGDVKASWWSSQRRPSDEEAPRSTVGRWTIVHGFLAVMGGIAIEMADDDSQTDPTDRITNFFPMKKSTKIHWQHGRPTLTKSQRQRSRLTLTLDGLQFLKRKRHDRLIPNLSEERIKDKSKGSAMAKTLVCFQAFWFCVQCLTRFAQGLAISLLELNTLGHAICTLFIYALWWNKPLDVVEPETVLIHPCTEREELEKAKLIAAMCSASRLDKEASESDHLGWSTSEHYTLTSEFSFPVYYGKKDMSDCHIDLSGKPLGEPRYKSSFILDYRCGQQEPRTFPFGNVHTTTGAPFGQTVVRDDINAKRSRVYLHVGESTALLEKVRSGPQEGHLVVHMKSDNGGNSEHGYRSKYSSPNSTSTTQMPYIVIQNSDIIRWQLALEYPRYIRLPKDPFTDRVRNLPRFQDYDQYLPIFIGFGIVGLIYGGLHCVAWNAPFTTSVERILWRISSITIAATGVLVACLFSWTKLPPFWRDLGRPINVIFDFLASDPWRGKDGLGKWLSGQTVVEYFLDDKSFYRKNWLVKVLCNVVIHLVWLPVTYSFLLALVSTIFLKVLFDIFTVLFGVLYVLARIYLVVISFINLAHLPDSAYQLPQWSRYVPHIG